MKEFVFTSVTDEKVLVKFSDNEFIISELLNNNLKLSDYSKNIKQILFVWVCTEPDKAIPRPDSIKFIRKTKTLQIVYNLNYSEIVIQCRLVKKINQKCHFKNFFTGGKSLSCIF